MSKLILCDSRESMYNKFKILADELSNNNRRGLEIEAIHGDVFKVQKQNQGYKICTASNPNFTFGGGLDLAIAKNFPDEISQAKEFSWSDNLFFTVTVNENLQATKEIIQRALVGVLSYRSKNLILTGIGTGIGGLSEDELVNLIRANLIRANLRGADLIRADLRNADLRNADLIRANLIRANLGGANLEGANLEGANLRDANLGGAIYSDGTIFPAYFVCPEQGNFIAWKATQNYIVQLEIIGDRTSNLINRKCRTSKAKVLGFYNISKELLPDITSDNSKHDSSFVYNLGETVEVANYNNDFRIDCAEGIHFFITFEEAKNWL